MKLANIDEENLHIFRTTLGTSMKFPGKMYHMILLVLKKNTEGKGVESPVDT